MSVAEYLRPEEWLGQSAGPRYVQLRRRLEHGIETGVFAPNSSLPPEREIADITDLSRVTVRKAIQELVKEGVVEQRQGSGSFVREKVARVEQSLSHLTSFTEDMERRGLETTSKWLERGIFLPSPDEVVALGLASATHGFEHLGMAVLERHVDIGAEALFLPHQPQQLFVEGRRIGIEEPDPGERGFF